MGKVINPDEYITCRGIPVRKALIDEFKQKHGRTLVENPNTLRKLDAALAEFRRRNGRDPVSIEGDDGYRYFFEHVVVPLDLYFKGLNISGFVAGVDALDGEVQIPSPKPIWFASPKAFTIGGRHGKKA